MAAIAYVDPGNIATNTVAGGQYGYALVWVVVLATLMAGPVQYLSAKLGTASGMSLSSLIAQRSGHTVRRCYWAQAQLVAMATDVAEIVGAAVAMYLLWGVPLLIGGGVAAITSTAVLLTQDRLGPRVLQSFSMISLVAIGSGFGYGLLRRAPDLAAAASGLVPRLDGSGVVLLACAIVGATVMPHAIYLHSDLAAWPSVGSVRTRLRVVRTDVVVAMAVAGTINVAMLLFGASILGGFTDQDLGAITSQLAQRAGDGVATAFLIALLVSGLSSSAVGTQAGSVIAKSLLRRDLGPIALRAATIVPTLVLLTSGVSPVQALVWSQVVLALGLPFALVPLLRLTGDREVVGDAMNRVPLRIVAGVIVVAVVLLDLALIVSTIQGL